jgi:hypothetical protein
MLLDFEQIVRMLPPRCSSSDPRYFAVKKRHDQRWRIACLWAYHEGGPVPDFVTYRDGEYESPEASQAYLDEFHCEKAYSGRDESEWMKRR